MNRLSAIRSFGNPGYSPAKRVRIQNNKWYLVTFQNTESDPRTDYHGLAEGEYTQLLPGKDAREARDSHLNHCNHIADYPGPVFAVWTSAFGYAERLKGYYRTESAAGAAIQSFQAEGEQYKEACLAEAEQYDSYTPERVRGRMRGTAFVDDQDWVAAQVEQYRQIAERCRSSAQNYTSTARIERLR